MFSKPLVCQGLCRALPSSLSPGSGLACTAQFVNGDGI